MNKVICVKCEKEFNKTKNDNHKKCPRCKQRSHKKLCKSCGIEIINTATLCVVCNNRLQKKENNPNWKGGKAKHTNGYKYIRVENHPRATKTGYVFEHIIVMEKYLGRYVELGETIHHKNGIKSDNRIENLELWSKSHPSGSRVKDLIEWAIYILNKYAPDKLK